MKIMRTLALFITIWMSAFSIGKAQEISGPQLYQYSFQTPSGTSNLTGYYQVYLQVQPTGFNK